MFAGIQKALLLTIVAGGFCLIATNNLAHAQDRGAAPIISMTKIDEFIDKQERISGGAAVGATFYDPEDRIELNAVYVLFDTPVSDSVQLQLATVDGRFLAIFEHSPTAPLSGWRGFELSVSKPDFLDKYEPQEIAILVTRAGTDAIYPARWGKDGDTETIRIFLNSEGSTSYFATFDVEQNKLVPKQCQTASQRSSFKFDRICDIPVADIRANNSVDIMRKRGPDFGRSVNVTIAVDGKAN